MQKAILIFSAIFLGMLFTIGHQFTYIIRYNLMVMLFFSFLGIQINLKDIRVTHFKILLLNILLPLVFYLILQKIDQSLAQTAFVLTVVPTAAVGAVIAEMMGKQVSIITYAILMTTTLIALLLPLVLPFVVSADTQAISTTELIYPVLSLIFIPLIFSQLLRNYFTTLTTKLLAYNYIVFPIFLLNIFVACGNASYFVKHNEAIGIQELLSIFALTSLIGAIQFQLGQFIGKGDTSVEYSLALGQKNTMMGLWLAFTYFAPVVALGPICYIIIQNAYNSFQMWQIAKSKI